MYNRYMQSEYAEDASQPVDYIPVIQDTEYRTSAPIQSECRQQKETCECAQPQENTKGKDGFLAGLLNFKDFNLETVFILVLAMFLLCDKLEDSGNSILILLVLVLLGF